MSTSFAYEDPYLRAQSQAGLSNTQKAREIFKDMGKGMWRSGKGFGKVGALFAGIECVIEGASCSRYRLGRILMLLFPVSSKKRHGKSSGCRFRSGRNSRATFGTQGRLGRWPGICSIFSRNRFVPPSRTCRVSTTLVTKLFSNIVSVTTNVICQRT